MHGGLHDVSLALPRLCGAVPAGGPGGKNRAGQMYIGPPRGEMRLVREKKAEAGKLRLLLPESLGKAEAHANDRAHFQKAGGIFFLRQCGRKRYARSEER